MKKTMQDGGNDLRMLMRLIPKLYFKLQALSENGLKESGVSPGQRALMEDIDLGGPQSIGALASARPVAKQYVQKLVADLVKRGLVSLSPNPNDGRSKLVRLTAKGRKKIAEWRKGEEESIVNFLATVSTKDVSTSLALLRRLHEALNAEIHVEK